MNASIAAQDKPIVRQFRILLFPEQGVREYYKLIFGRVLGWGLLFITITYGYFLGKAWVERPPAPVYQLPAQYSSPASPQNSSQHTLPSGSSRHKPRVQDHPPTRKDSLRTMLLLLDSILNRPPADTPASSGREREFVNIYRSSDAARELTDEEFEAALKFVRSSFEAAQVFRAEKSKGIKGRAAK